MINVTGNSHCRFFCGADEIGGIDWKLHMPVCHIEGFKVYPLSGGVTAYNFTEKYLPRIYEMNIPKKEKLLLCVGEIDCRYQMPMRTYELREMLGVIEACQVRFFEGCRKLTEDYEVGLWGVHPVTRKTESPDRVARTAVFRTATAKMWNEEAAEKCRYYGIRFFNMFDSLTGPDGLVDDRCLMDDVHLNQSVMKRALEVLGDWR